MKYKDIERGDYFKVDAKLYGLKLNKFDDMGNSLIFSSTNLKVGSFEPDADFQLVDRDSIVNIVNEAHNHALFLTKALCPAYEKS